MSQQQVLSAIEQEIASLENQRLPRNLGYNPTRYEQLSAEISDLKTTRGRINAASSRGPAALQSELTRAIQRHTLMVSSSAAAAPSAAAPSFTGPPRGINGTPAAAATASAPTPAAASAYTSPAAASSSASAAPAPSPGGGTTESKEEDPCSVCLEDLNDGTPIHKGPCGHRLHQTCYNQLHPAWSAGPKAGQKKCPVCRYNQPVPGPLVEPLRSQIGFGRYIM